MKPLTLSNKKKQEPSWAIVRDAFTGDELIEAYFKGCREGVDQFKKVLIKKLEENLSLAQHLGTFFISQLNKEIEICSNAHLKYMDIERYKIIFVIRETIYYDFNQMYPIYAMAEAFENENSNTDFTIEVAFIPEIKAVNTHRLISDGFIFHYNG